MREGRLAVGQVFFSHQLGFTKQGQGYFDLGVVRKLAAADVDRFVAACAGGGDHSCFLRLDPTRLHSARGLLCATCAVCRPISKKIVLFPLERRAEHFKTNYHAAAVNAHWATLRPGLAIPPSQPEVDEGNDGVEDLDSSLPEIEAPPPAPRPAWITFLSPNHGTAGTPVTLFSQNVTLPGDCTVFFDCTPAALLPPPAGNTTVLLVTAPALRLHGHTQDHDVTVPVIVVHHGHCISCTNPPLQFVYTVQDKNNNIAAIESTVPTSTHPIRREASPLSPSDWDTLSINALSYAVARGDAKLVRHLTEALRRAGVPQHEWLVRDGTGRHAADWAMERSMYFTDEAAHEIFSLLGILPSSNSVEVRVIVTLCPLTLRCRSLQQG